MRFTIQYRRKDSETWTDWRFCSAARVATWKSEAKANAYCERLKVRNPDCQFRVVGWLEAFSIPAR